jgi:putative ABC transport system permease protein
VRIEALLYLYRRRLRTHPVQELLAGMGIAVGVALAFAVMVANSSVAGSADRIVQGVTGNANLQLTARDAGGFDARLLGAVRRLPGVELAAPLLEQRAVLRARDGRQVAVDIASIDASLAELSGRLPAIFATGGLRLTGGVVLPGATATKLGLPDQSHAALAPQRRLTLLLDGRAVPVTIAAVLGQDTIGPLAGAQIAVMSLEHLQRVSGLRGRITRILVETQPGREAQVRRALSALTGGRLDVRPADDETRLLQHALRPSDQATGFFAAISALLGFLLAFNAMLLTAPERRRLLAELRIQGFRRRQLVVLTLFQAALLGIVASVAGLLIGDVLTRSLFDLSPSYLSPPFTLGTRTIVGTTPLLVALLGGIAASCLAAAPPLLDLRRGRPVDAALQSPGAPGNAFDATTRRRMLAGAGATLAVASALLQWAPSVALLASALLALATMLAIPATFAAVLRLGEALAARFQQLSMLTIALLALRATTLRSLALAATGAVAVFGSVAIGGARDDLLRGIGQYTSDYVGTADVWVVNPLDNQATNEIADAGMQARIATVPGVATVRAYRGSFLDVPSHRLWLIARSPADRAMLPASQMVRGDLATATARLRAGGWIAVSDQLAREHHVRIGGTLRLPTPSGEVGYRLAATTTNLGWSPGAVILNGADYRRAWPGSSPTAYEVDLAAGASAPDVQRAIMRALGPGAGVVAESARQRGARIDSAASQGLSRLGQISLLLLVAAVLAMAAAMGAAIWQRRASLAALRIQSFTPRQLWRVLLLEAGVVLGAGCLTGALTGVYGQVGADRYLRVVTGFPVAAEPATWRTLQIFVIVVAAALAVVAIPGWFASRAPPHLGLQE